MTTKEWGQKTPDTTEVVPVLPTIQDTPTQTERVAQNVAGIISEVTTAPELSDEQQMIATLNALQENLEPVMTRYHELYGTTFNNISLAVSGIEDGFANGLKPETIVIRTIFSGLHEPDAESGICLNILAANLQEEAPFFRELLSEFEKKNTEEKASMLRFFEWIDSSLITKSDKKWMKNPLKKILFGDNNASYKEWIVGIFVAFEKNASEMISLSKSIQAAEAPNIPLPSKFQIRQLFPTNPEIFEEADRAWLTNFYENYPDVTVMSELIKTDMKAEKQVVMHNELNKKYMLICAPEGSTTEEAKKMAQSLRSIIDSWKTD